MKARLLPLLLGVTAALILAGCNSTAQNAPPPDLSAGPAANPLPAPPEAGVAAQGPSVQPASAPPAGGMEPLAAPPGGRAALVSDPDFQLPEGGGCAGSVERFQALVNNDLKTGHTTRSVHDEITAELTSLRGRCANGENVSDEVVLLRQRFGYPSS